MEIKFLDVFHEYPIKRKVSIAAIKNINLTFNEKDEFISVIGKTGSGKSTLIEHINGLLLPTSGSVDVLGNVLTKNKKKNPHMSLVRKRVGFVFQFPEYQLFEETVLKDIKFAPVNFHLSKEEIDENIKSVVEKLDIKDILDKSPFALSGGQMRRVAIAGILAYNPDILLLDEPTRGLDPKGQEYIMKLFYEIHKNMHKTIIMITHDMDIAYKYSTRMIVMNEGNVIYDGKKENLFKNEDFEKYNLEKPQVLKAIDYIKANTGIDIDYNTYSIDELFNKLKEASHE